jgi:hypothetical protein
MPVFQNLVAVSKIKSEFTLKIQIFSHVFIKWDMDQPGFVFSQTCPGSRSPLHCQWWALMVSDGHFHTYPYPTTRQIPSAHPHQPARIELHASKLRPQETGPLMLWAIPLLLLVNAELGKGFDDTELRWPMSPFCAPCQPNTRFCSLSLNWAKGRY